MVPETNREQGIIRYGMYVTMVQVLVIEQCLKIMNSFFGAVCM
jgi:hypothetical protein